MKGGRGSGRASTGQVRLWGRHAVEAALLNPERKHRKLWATREGIASLDGELPADFPIEYAEGPDLDRLVARDAPHQGLVLECAALEDRDRHAPPESGVVAKSASGALETVPWVRVVNLARALDDLSNSGFWRIGLAGEAEMTLAQAMPTGPVAIVLGAEGAGLRHNIAGHCDALAKLPISDAIESLNVSNAAAIALYALATRED